MNYRVSKKIYKRADFKLKSFIAANHDKRTTYDIAKEENILKRIIKYPKRKSCKFNYCFY